MPDTVSDDVRRVLGPLYPDSNLLSVGDLLNKFWLGEGFGSSESAVDPPTGSNLQTWLKGKPETASSPSDSLQDLWRTYWANR